MIVLLLLRPTIPHALVLRRSGEKSKADDDGAFARIAMTMAMKVDVKRLFILDVDDDSCIYVDVVNGDKGSCLRLIFGR